jgi:hypothetical protein
MPQLIAMVIVVVGAMIYMFQTFGGTGDKIEGIAQKTSVITEINNIKNGLKLAARAEQIGATSVPANDEYTTLEGLAELAYFPEQINSQIIESASNGAGADNFNTYKAISFGGDATVNDGALELSLVADTAGYIPGIFVDLTKGSLADNAAFLETQIANDLGDVAFIDRTATSPATANPATPRKAAADGGTALEVRTPADNGNGGSTSDGQFIIYFKDFAASEVIK